MTRRSSWGWMADRVQQTRANAATPQPLDEAAPEGPLPTDVKHCWVLTPAGPMPGLLIGWRRDSALGWLGRVVRPVGDQYGWLVAEDWLPATDLRPALGKPPHH